MLVKIYLINCEDISLDSLLNSKYISPLEKSSFDKYKNDEVKKEKITSAYLKNKYVGKYNLNEYGKPISDSVYFNVSHSHCLVGLVIDNVPVGIDIEKIRLVDKKLSDYVSDELEKNYIRDDQSFYEIWTNKEALVKCVGTGIKMKMNTIPGLPINGKREYQGDIYFNKTIKHGDFIITISRQKDEDFTLEIVWEDINKK